MGSLSMPMPECGAELLTYIKLVSSCTNASEGQNRPISADRDAKPCKSSSWLTNSRNPTSMQSIRRAFATYHGPRQLQSISRVSYRQFSSSSITMSKQAILTENAPKPRPFYSQAIKAGGFIYCSGQTATDPATGKLVEGTVADRTV